jgi:hypothetical protein
MKVLPPLAASLFLVLASLKLAKCFVPHKLVDLMVQKTDQQTQYDFGKVEGETFTHEEILKRGMLRSIAKYFHERLSTENNDTTLNRINLSKLDTGEYYDLRELFYDFYQKR